MEDFLLVIPLIVILVLLLPPFRFHPIPAGLVGGVLAMLVGRIPIGEATNQFAEGTTRLLGIAPVIVFAATAITLARAGSMSSALALTRRYVGDRMEIIAPAMVIVQALATYASGTGASNLLVTAPLVFTAMGFIPSVVGALGIASAAGWSVSPAAAETALIADAMGLEVVEYVTLMRPYAAVMWVLAAILAYVGARSAARRGEIRPGQPPAGATAEFEDPEEQALLGDESVSDWNRMMPFILLLLLIIFSPLVNRLAGVPLLGTLTIPFITLIVAALLIRININVLARTFVESSRTILGLLFMVGVFLGFINLLTYIGTFEVIASLPAGLPLSLMIVGSLIIAFLIAIPSGSYTAAVMAFLVPVFQAIGVPSIYFGFMTMVVAMGAMMSPVQVSVTASALGFRVSVMDIVRNNARFQPIAGAIVIIIALVAVTIFI